MATPTSQSSRLHVLLVYYRWLVVLAGAGLLLYTTLLSPRLLNPWVWSLTVLFVAFLVNFPPGLLHNEMILIQGVTWTGSLLYGAATSSWATVFGVVLGLFIHWFWPGASSQTSPAKSNWETAVFAASRHNLAILLALLITNQPNGLVNSSTNGMTETNLGSILAPLLLFILLNGAFMVVELGLQKSGPPFSLKRESYVIALEELILLPFVTVVVLAYPRMGIGSLLPIGGAGILVAVLMKGITNPKADLERRLQELSTLNQISDVLRSGLGLENLLTTIQLQIDRLLGVDNFYVAIYEPSDETIWYPLAVKFGERQQWAERVLADRLTDQVIRNRKPLIINSFSAENISALHLPPSNVTPTAWIGVPLISSDRVIGCLAIFSLVPYATFSETDLNLLMIISGQISVAIENSLLYEQAQRRATQLETLNRVNQLLTASLAPQEVLAQVCRSATELSGGSRSALFLLEQDSSMVRLAYAHELSNEFVTVNQSFSIAQNGWTRCLRTGLPTLVPDLQISAAGDDHADALKRESILAFGDFPLATTEGQIGLLSVYYDSPHIFGAGEVELLQTFASQAALAVSNARLHASTDMALSQRVHQLSILEAVGRELAAEIRSDRLFEMILNYALEFTNSPWGSLGIYNSSTRSIEIKAERGYPSELITYTVDIGISGRAVRTSQVINAGDVRLDPDYVNLIQGEALSQLSIPLLYEERVLGVLTLEKPQLNGYTASDQTFISQLAIQAAVAVVNAELYSDTTQGRDRLAAVLNSVKEGILMIEAGGTITLVNESLQAITGILPSELVGKQLIELHPKILRTLGYSPVEAKELSYSLNLGKVPVAPKISLKPTEARPERFLERASLPVWGQGGRVIGWMIMLRDVSEEYQVAQQRELITETLVHDLRSPLSAVIGALDIMEENPPQEDQPSELYIQAMRVARRSSQRVLEMVESMMDISRMQSGGIELSFNPLLVQILILNVIGDFIPQATEYGVFLRNEIPAEIPRVYVDHNKISRVIVNLLDNALKFTPSGGQVIFSARQLDEDKIAVQVADTGPGVPEEFREKVFERFTQIPGLHGRRRGSGLGLTFCKLAVEAHGGRIWVEPRPGGGSSFVFTLPIARQGQDLGDS